MSLGLFNYFFFFFFFWNSKTFILLIWQPLSCGPKNRWSMRNIWQSKRVLECAKPTLQLHFSHTYCCHFMQ